MSAVIRIKRHITEEPQEAFVLNCKKRKTENSSEIPSNSNETSTVLKFAGTVHQDTNINEHIAKLTKEEARDIVSRKKPEESRLQSRRDENRQKSQQNRFKIVNFTRGNNDQEDNTSKDKSLTIVDVEKDRITSEASTSSSTQPGASTSFSDVSEDPYVYDIYIAENGNALHQDSIDMNDLSILEYNDYLYSRTRLVNNSDESENDEDEDSNDENNWKNDYPDEDEMYDDESVGEGEMRRAMDDLDFGHELSSDDENDNNGFVYSIDAEGIGFEDDLDYGDVNRYGEAYARYKRKVVKELYQNNYDECDDNDSDVDDFIESD